MQIKNRLASVFFVQLIILSVFASIQFIDLKSTAILLIFNFLFVSITFQLNGSYSRKLGLLALGNMLGFLWNYTFASFAVVDASFFGETFSIIYTISYPFLDSLWIVTFWSLSLTVLPRPQVLQAERPQFDY
jgi:hypothetical protein